jgi:DNA adenine methylase
MRTPITYYGGKQQLASVILGMMPSHKVYCEPYLGGGAVFFAKGKSFCECINDIDDRIVTFYDVCRDIRKFQLLQQRIQNTLDIEREFLRADRIWRDPKRARSKIEIAWSVWLQCNMGYGGSPEGGWKWDNGTSGSHSGVVMDGYRNQFTYKIHERLKHVQISCRDALKVIRQRDTEETFFFLDPPYPGCVQKHYKGFGFDDLEKLLEQLTVIKGKFLLCNFGSDLLDGYVHRNGWNKTVIDMPLRVANRTTKGTKRKQEIMVYNYELEPKLFE